MFQGLRSKQQVIAWCLALMAGCWSALVQAQPDLPGRVGRVADLSGSVWIFDDEAGDWTLAERNRPVTSGDRISTAADGRAEIRIGSTSLRIGARSELEVLRLDDDGLEFHLHTGSAALRLRTREAAEHAVFSTPEARFKALRSGHYRFDRTDDTTFAASLNGELLLDGAVSFPLASGQRMEFWRERAGAALQHRWASLPQDELAQWILREDQQEQRSASSRYVSPEMTGAEDLDRYGRWEQHPEYGAIWMPVSVAIGWEPYRHGRWIWLRPWGWTWVDQQPWGFAPFHYGRWVQWRGRWCWTPGAYVARPVYAPALVTWVGASRIGNGFGSTVDTRVRRPLPGSNWVPLAPREPYVPHHPAHPGWSDRVNQGQYGYSGGGAHPRVRPPVPPITHSTTSPPPLPAPAPTIVQPRGPRTGAPVTPVPQQLPALAPPPASPTPPKPQPQPLPQITAPGPVATPPATAAPVMPPRQRPTRDREQRDDNNASKPDLRDGRESRDSRDDSRRRGQEPRPGLRLREAQP